MSRSRRSGASRRFLDEHGAVPGIQIAHAGRKASVAAPWRGGGPLGPDERGWQPVAPSAVPYDDGWLVPRELEIGELGDVVEAFAASARRSLAAGFRLLEVHAAHGYLLHEFLSPLSNRRSDAYGGDFAGRTRLAARGRRGGARGLAGRAAAGGAHLGQRLGRGRLVARGLRRARGRCSGRSASTSSTAPRAATRLRRRSRSARAIRCRSPRRSAQRAGIPTAAVGLITEPQQAEDILQAGEADVVLLGRESLRDASWPLRAAAELGVESDAWPAQYLRAQPRTTAPR